MRKAHTLAAQKKLELPATMVFFDTETLENPLSSTTTEQVFRLGVASYVRLRVKGKRSWTHREVFKFDKIAQFWTWLESKTLAKTRLWVFAHNLQFDWLVLKGFNSMLAHGWTQDKVMYDANVTVFTYIKGTRTLYFVDSLNYFRTSLQALGASIGLPKLPMPEFKQSKRTWFTYCERDVEILETAILKYIELLKVRDLGSFRVTTPAIAFSIFRHRFMTEKILIHDRRAVLNLEREGYYGGRCECFRVGRYQGEFHILDVNSLYPYIMNQHASPHKVLLSGIGSGCLDLLKRSPNYGCMARVLLKTEQRNYPTRYNDKLIFPVGQFWTVLPFPEFELARKRGHILKIGDYSLYELVNLFMPYTTELYALRQEFKHSENKVFEYLIKLLLNSLYGKWGQRSPIWDDCADAQDFAIKDWLQIDAQTKEVKHFRQLGSKVFVKAGLGESWNSFPAISGFITSHARVKLLSLIEQAGWDNTYYCDTDSLIVNNQGLSNIKGEVGVGELGKLKLERSGEVLTIHTLKNYSLDDYKRSKGIRASAKLIAPNTYEQDKFVGIRGLFQREVMDKQFVDKVVKHLKLVYDKGVVLDNGVVDPIRFDGSQVQAALTPLTSS